jgi:hypothetical protein
MGSAKARFPDYSKAPPALKMSGDDWKRLEKAYGLPLSSPLRAQIIQASEILKLNAIFADGQRIADAEERIKRIQQRAKALHAAFRGGRPSPSHWFGDLCIESQFSTDLSNAKVSSVSTLIKQIKTLVTACTGALAYLDRTAKNTPSKRGVWNLWVQTLTSTLCENGLPTGARKDVDKQKGGNPSAFVAFVREMQNSVPQEYRPLFQSDDALAQAIVRARRL